MINTKLYRILNKLYDMQPAVRYTDSDGNEYTVTQMQNCLAQLLLTDKEIERAVDKTPYHLPSFEDIVKAWYHNGVLSADNPMFSLLSCYCKEDYRGVVYNWLANSKLYTIQRLANKRQSIQDQDDMMSVFKYMPDSVIQRLAKEFIFLTDVSCAALGLERDEQSWLRSLARKGWLAFDPYVYFDAAHSELALPIKFNSVLRYKDDRFQLTDGKAVFVESGQLPSLTDLCFDGCGFILYLAAVSVAIYNSAFLSEENLNTLSQYCIKLFAQNNLEYTGDLYKEVLDRYTTTDSELYEGYRICKTPAWDYMRWAEFDWGYRVVIPNMGLIDTYEFVIGNKDNTGVINSVRNDDDRTTFNLITGVVSMLGIYLTNTRAWSLDTKQCMPARRPEKFKRVYSLRDVQTDEDGYTE